METRIDHTTGGIYRISTFTPEFASVSISS